MTKSLIEYLGNNIYKIYLPSSDDVMCLTYTKLIELSQALKIINNELERLSDEQG